MNISVNRVRHLQGTRFFSLIKNCYLLPSVRYSSTNQPKIADSDMTLTKNEYKPKLQNAEQAVNNILSNVNLQSTLPVLTKHIINCMVVNEIGVISRVSGALSGMGININSLVVAQTELHNLSRITITINGQDEKINRAKKQLEELVPVWAVINYIKTSTIYREILLIKVSRTDLEPTNLSCCKKQSITELVKFFNAKVVDINHDCMMIELTAKSDRIDAFMELLRPFGILEAIRSGVIAMPRSYIKVEMQVSLEEKQEIIDSTLLPPG